MRRITHLIVHHSATPDDDKLSVQAIRRFHTSPPPEGRGWKNIAYHFLIDRLNDSYEIVVGRFPEDAGSHATGWNTISIGICCVGNFDKQPMPKEQYDVLIGLLSSLMQTHGIKAENILGHRETYVAMGVPVQKSCPGNMVDMNEIRKSLS